MYKLVLVFGALGLLASCSTASDFIRDDQSINSYDRSFSTSEWSYDEYLVTRSHGFSEVHESIAFQWATSNNGEQVLSIAFQTYSHNVANRNQITIVADGISFTLTDLEPEFTNVAFNNDVVERNVVVINPEVGSALLNAAHVQFQYVNVTNVNRESLGDLQNFLRSHLHTAMQ